ncbi:MAG: hypothetical protein R3F11_19465 [Verrucomicrobiales bacterium]
MKRLLPFLALLCAIAVCDSYAAAKRGGFALSFHLQGIEQDGEKFVFKDEINGKTVYLSRIPTLTTDDIESFHPFDARNGTKGAVIQLNRRGTQHLESISATASGRYLRAIITRKSKPTPIDYVVIDRTVTDGRLVVWKGLNDDDIKSMDKYFKRLDPRTASR